jgi:hypothetical protein
MRFYQCVLVSLVASLGLQSSVAGSSVEGEGESVDETQDPPPDQDTQEQPDSRFKSSDQQHQPPAASRASESEHEGRQTSNMGSGSEASESDTIPPPDLIHTPVNQAQAAEGIAMNEMLFFKQITSVAQTLSKMGIQGVNMGTHVHVLNTYLDLVQRIMSHLGVIAGAETATKTQIDELIAQMTEVAAFKLSGSAKKQEAAEGEH